MAQKRNICCITDGRRLVFIAKSAAGDDELHDVPLSSVQLSRGGHLKLPQVTFEHLRAAEKSAYEEYDFEPFSMPPQ